MLDIELQEVLVQEVKDALKGFSLLNDSKESKVNVYSQNLPAKQGKDDDFLYPYVQVCIDQQVIDDEESQNLVGIYFLVGIKDKRLEKQGHKDVLNIMNKLSERFLKKRLVYTRYRFQFPITKKLQETDTFPYYMGGMTTFWEIQKPFIQEDIYD